MTSWPQSGVRPGDGQYGAIVKLLMLTGARRDEIASLRWSEIDLDAATITLSPARTKNRREHVIPLSEPALADPGGAAAKNGKERDLVFGRGDRGFQDWSGSKADLDVRIATARKGRALEWRCTISGALSRPRCTSASA